MMRKVRVVCAETIMPCPGRDPGTLCLLRVEQGQEGRGRRHVRTQPAHNTRPAGTLSALYFSESSPPNLTPSIPPKPTSQISPLPPPTLSPPPFPLPFSPPGWLFSLSFSLGYFIMGNCCSADVDFTGEPSLYHFNLHRAVGRGAFGKVIDYLRHRTSRPR
jgi:hypothetical protein